MTIMIPILGVVSYLHSQQPPLIHQNIEPDSIIISKADIKPVLVDFGVGKQYNLSSQDVPIRGPVIGYEAPEQYGGEISTRTDIYGLGATLYTLLTGIVAADALYRKRLIESENANPLKPVIQLAPAVPEPVGEVIHRAMSINSDDRFSTVEQFWEALKHASNATTVGQQITEPAVTAPSEEKTESETHSMEDVKPLVGIEEAPTVATLPTVQLPQEVAVASPDSPPVVPEEVKSPTTSPLQEPAQVRHFKKPGMHFLTLFALLVTLLGSLRVGAGIWFYITSQHSPTSAAPSSGSQLAVPSPQPTVNPQPTGASTPVPVSPSFPNLAKLYTGTLGDIPTGVTLKISLTSIQQQQDSISGYLSETPENNHFSQIPKSGPFQGTVNTSKEIQFTLMDDTGQATFSFNGSILADSSIQGSFCSLEAAAGRCGDYGLWSVSPGP
jgi:eukaryotic-like serine/threonine-protein kinase